MSERLNAFPKANFRFAFSKGAFSSKCFSHHTIMMIAFSPLLFSIPTSSFEVSADGRNLFTILEERTSCVEFNNGNRYDEELTISNGFLRNSVVLKFRTDASSNADQVYLDDIVLEACGGTSLVTSHTRARSNADKIKLSPNPVNRLHEVGKLISDEEIRYE